MSESEQKSITRELRNSLRKFKASRLDKIHHSDCPVKSSHFFLLHLISQFEQGTTASDIASEMDITMGAVTHYIKELEELTLIKKAVSADDKRVTYIALSEKGEEHLKMAKEMHNHQMNSLVEYLGIDDSKKLIELINKISEFSSNKK